jgi:hypothetical protein
MVSTQGLVQSARRGGRSRGQEPDNLTSIGACLFLALSPREREVQKLFASLFRVGAPGPALGLITTSIEGGLFSPKLSRSSREFNVIMLHDG